MTTGLVGVSANFTMPLRRNRLGPCTERSGFGGKASDVHVAAERERTPRVDVRADRVAVMDEEELQASVRVPIRLLACQDAHRQPILREG